MLPIWACVVKHCQNVGYNQPSEPVPIYIFIMVMSIWVRKKRCKLYDRVYDNFTSKCTTPIYKTKQVFSMLGLFVLYPI